MIPPKPACQTRRRSTGRAAPAAALGAAALLAALGCGTGDTDPAGPPVLLAFELFDETGAAVAPLDESGKPAILSPRLSFAFRFDRLLDGELLEDVVGGVATGKPGIVQITAPGQPQAAITYLPNGDVKLGLLFPTGPQLLARPVPTLPSGSTVTVSLDRDQIRSKGGAGPALLGEGVTDAITLTTAPFSASISAGAPGPEQPPAPLAPDAAIVIAFSNLPEPMVATRIAIAVTDGAGNTLAGAAAAPVPSAADPALWTVGPQGPSWPPGATIEISVDRTCTDALGAPLAQPTTASFVVQP